MSGAARVWRLGRHVVPVLVVLLAGVVASGIRSKVVAVGFVATVALLAFGPSRRLLRRACHRVRLRWQWTGACRHAGLVNLEGRIPLPKRVQAVPCGDLLKVRMAPGQEAAQLADAAERIAAFLEVRELRVAREASNARIA